MPRKLNANSYTADMSKMTIDLSNQPSSTGLTIPLTHKERIDALREEMESLKKRMVRIEHILEEHGQTLEKK